MKKSSLRKKYNNISKIIGKDQICKAPGLIIDTNHQNYQKNALIAVLLITMSFIYLSGQYSDGTSSSLSGAENNNDRFLYDYLPIAEAAGIDIQKPTSSPAKIVANKSYNELYFELMPILKNTPMEVMANDISKKDRRVAGFIVGIAMKESKFGRYSPKKNGRDCYNYWGYRGKENPTASGYSCFKSPEQAIAVVGGRIEGMVEGGAKKPADMITWKCGYSCAGHSNESVRKWIADVAIHYYQINPKNQIVKK